MLEALDLMIKALIELEKTLGTLFECMDGMVIVKGMLASQGPLRASNRPTVVG